MPKLPLISFYFSEILSWEIHFDSWIYSWVKYERTSSLTTLTNATISSIVLTEKNSNSNFPLSIFLIINFVQENSFFIFHPSNCRLFMIDVCEWSFEGGINFAEIEKSRMMLMSFTAVGWSTLFGNLEWRGVLECWWIFAGETFYEAGRC